MTVKSKRRDKDIPELTDTYLHCCSPRELAESENISISLKKALSANVLPEIA